jgi:hypothetical protein
MSNPLIEPTLEILRATRDGDDLAPQHLKLVEMAVNGHLNDKRKAAFQELVENVRKGYTPPWFHGIENLTIDHYDYVLWKGQRVEHFNPSWAWTEKGKRAAQELAERCRQLEAEGKDVNKFNAVLNWTDIYYSLTTEGAVIRLKVARGRTSQHTIPESGAWWPVYEWNGKKWVVECFPEITWGTHSKMEYIGKSIDMRFKK